MSKLFGKYKSTVAYDVDAFFGRHSLHSNFSSITQLQNCFFESVWFQVGVFGNMCDEDAQFELMHGRDQEEEKLRQKKLKRRNESFQDNGPSEEEQTKMINNYYMIKNKSKKRERLRSALTQPMRQDSRQRFNNQSSISSLAITYTKGGQLQQGSTTYSTKPIARAPSRPSMVSTRPGSMALIGHHKKNILSEHMIPSQDYVGLTPDQNLNKPQQQLDIINNGPEDA